MEKTFLYLIVIIQSIVLLFFLFQWFKSKRIKKEWDSILYNQKKQSYVREILQKNEINPNLLRVLNYYLDTTAMFENIETFSNESFHGFLKNHEISTDPKILEKKFSKFFVEHDSLKDEIANMGKHLHEKSYKILNLLTHEGDDAELKFNNETLLFYFLVYDFLELLINQNWATKSSLLNVNYVLNMPVEYPTYSGSDNFLKYDKKLYAIYTILKKRSLVPVDSQLILGYKFQ